MRSPGARWPPREARQRRSASNGGKPGDGRSGKAGHHGAAGRVRGHVLLLCFRQAASGRQILGMRRGDGLRVRLGCIPKELYEPLSRVKPRGEKKC